MKRFISEMIMTSFVYQASKRINASKVVSLFILMGMLFSSCSRHHKELPRNLQNEFHALVERQQYNQFINLLQTHRLSFSDLPISTISLSCVIGLKNHKFLHLVTETNEIRNRIKSDSELHHEIIRCASFALSQDQSKTTIQLIDLGLDVNQRLHIGETLLHNASSFNNIQVAVHLLKKGANPNAIIAQVYEYNRKKIKARADIPLIDATSYEMAKLLIEGGTDLTLIDEHGLNLLHVSAHIFRPGLMRALLETGKFDVNARTPDGKTALQFAKEFKYKEGVKMLLAAGAKE